MAASRDLACPHKQDGGRAGFYGPGTPRGRGGGRIINIIGNGVVLDPITMVRELKSLDEAGIDYQSRLLVSKKAHLIVPTHRYLDAASEASKGEGKIGSTLKGIGPAYMDKTGRNGLRVGDILSADFDQKYRTIRQKHLGLARLYPEIEFDLSGEETRFFECVEVLRKLTIVNSEYYINDALTAGKKILAEGAQGSMLDIDFRFLFCLFPGIQQFFQQYFRQHLSVRLIF